MIITPNFQFVSGGFDTKTTEIVCVVSRKYLSVELCVKSDNDKGWNIPIAELKLASGGTVGEIEPVYDDMCKLGEEIARRWNECNTKE
ncbi:MAG: hypothetical protein RRZ64_00165 [Rikenellaceae bacterium]